MKAVVIIALSFLVWTAGVSAQRRMEKNAGSYILIPERARIPDGAGLSKVDRGRVAMASFAGCTVDRKSYRLPKLLSLPANRMDSKVWAGLADDECLASGQMAFQPIILRGALFTELYRRRHKAVARGQTWTLPVVPFNDHLAIDADDPSPVTTAVLAFAACIVAKDPIHAKAIMLASTTSSAQDAAITALKPSLGPCLPEGQTITLSKSILEGAIGEIMYRGTAQPTSTASTETE